MSDGIHFKATTGEVLHENLPQTAVGGVANFLVGLHLQHFRHWLLRWFYVLGGLMGATCIATGLILFVEKRKKQHAKTNSQGSRVVDTLAVMAVAAVLLNWITTGDHLLRTIGTGYWPVAGMDLSLLATAVLAVFAARKVGQREAINV